MKSKFFVILAIIALVAFVVTLDHGQVWAQQQGSTKAQEPVDLEYSTLPDVDQTGAADAQQNLFTQPPDAPGGPYPTNTFDFGDSGQVDACANRGDACFFDLIGNRADLRVSFQGDPGSGGVPPPHWAVYYETPAGARGPKWRWQDLDADFITLHDPDQELDGLEVWGPFTSDDANCYSEQGDPNNFSVWQQIVPGNNLGYVPRDSVVHAVQHLGYTGDEALVDLDALMVYDYNFNYVWDEGDIIIFSIRAAGNWDGGEIVVLRFTGSPGSAQFLNHGGHLWNTAFQVAAEFQLFPATEEVDAIEAVYPHEEPQDSVIIYPEGHSIVPCPIPYPPCTDMSILNASASIRIIVKIWNRSGGGSWVAYSIDPGAYAKHHVEDGDCEMKVFDYETHNEIVECFFVQCKTPTLTQWGLITLVGLLFASAIFIMLRRRKAAVPA
jgi:hypothetical protein